MVRTVWGCEMEQQMARDLEMAKFINDAVVPEPLDPRHAFFGGRTNPISLYAKPKDGETIRYTDICRYLIGRCVLFADWLF